MDSVKRLSSVVKRKIGGKMFVVVSHSEPYVHYYEEDSVKCRRASGGLVAALDPVLQSCGGTWIAHASGSADMDMVDGNGEVQVPVDSPKYALRRVALPKEEISHYLDGAAHSSLWPWCHFAYVRPSFRDEDWPYYRKANRIFADSVLEAIKGKEAFVWIQDYHLSLVAKYIKEKRPDVVTAHFWHIPWPNTEVFRICPWGAEMLEALLHNDLLGFQIQYYANNFFDSVDQTLQARVDKVHSTIYYKDSETVVKGFPISIDFQRAQRASGKADAKFISALKRRLGIYSDKVVLGIDRLDYSKGIAEKLMVMDSFFAKNPEWAGKATLMQLASPTRTQVPAYKENTEKVLALVEDINYKWGRGKWKPVVFVNSFFSEEEVAALYRMADCCLVTALHDGMNLVSKEFAASRPDGEGVLVLSKFTGSSRQLKRAVQINPYAISETAAALCSALLMPLEERKARMGRMREEIEDNDIYKWAADIIENISRLESTAINSKG